MAGETPKELVRGIFEFKELPRIPFIPWVFSFAAKLEQVPLRKMLSDPTLLSKSLQSAQKLFGYDGIINIFDPSLEAEACGCEISWGEGKELPEVVSHPLDKGTTTNDLDISEIEKMGRLPIVLEATKRLVMLRGREIALIGVITGPLTLARLLKGDAIMADLESGSQETPRLIQLARNVALKLCRAYCELGVDIIAIAETMFGRRDPGLWNLMNSCLRTLWNVTRHYNAYPIVLVRECNGQDVEPVFGLRANGVVLSGNIDYEYVRKTAIKFNCCFSGNISCSALLGTQRQVKDAVRASVAIKEKRGFFLSTEWEIPYDTPVENVHEIMNTLHQPEVR